MSAELPVGIHTLHKEVLFNFQLNRWHSIGLGRLEDLAKAAGKIKRFEDWKPRMVEIAEAAVLDERLLNAAIYYRSAEFFTLYDDPDKEPLYDKFIELFYEALGEEEIEKSSVPYDDGALSTLKVPALGEKKGTILLHGGFDSFLEEWVVMMKVLASGGYDVIGFEGPGQGAALIKEGLAFDHRWERPVAAVIDHFDLDEVALFGLSLGGWLCLRAAAFEPRIRKVIASGGTLHYLNIIPGAIRWIFTFFMRYERLFNKSALMKMERNPRMKWEISNSMHITQAATPLEASRKLHLKLTREHMHAEQIRQDVLLLSGARDHFIPIRLHREQVEALVKAASVTDKVFTTEEQAADHCQVGNIGLALDTLLDWLDSTPL